jgi:hypothetical protein
MRKILLASTALVAMTSVSAMAADITISGVTEFKYTNDTELTPDESNFGVESDIAIKFSNTTDSGITTTMTYGFDDASGAADDMNASMTGDFGKILIVNSGADDGLVEGMSDKVNFANDGSDLAFGVGTGSVGGNDSISYQLPAVMEGLTIAVQHSNENTSEAFGYGATYNAGIATVRLAAMNNNTTENTAASISTTIAGVSFAYEQVSSDVVEGTTSETEFKGYGLSYVLADGIKLGYEAGDKEVGTTESSYTQVEIDYTVAPGITLSATSSEVDDTTDKSTLDINLALSF